MSINQNIPRAKKMSINLLSNLDDWDGAAGRINKSLRQVVVQKANVGHIFTYALQHVAGDTFVYRGRNGKNISFNKKRPVLTLTGTAAGHTQTFEYANKFGQWFVGTMPNDTNPKWSGWSKQIARVFIPRFSKVMTNMAMQPRLSNLNQAGSNFGIGCEDNQFARVEAAVSPDFKYFLIAYGDNQYNGYFALYDLDEINYALDHAVTSSKYVDITDIRCRAAFMIPNLSGANGQVGSLQGFSINAEDNQIAIYVSSQPSDDKVGLDRKIIKIPWGETNSTNWEMVDLTGAEAIEIPGYYTEVEGIQVIDRNDVYLTVAYHQGFNLPNPLKHPTKINRVYRINWKMN